jgi:hypothetical protein
MRQLLIILTLLVVFSCELAVEIEIPYEASKLVINSIITPDSTFTVFVSATGRILTDDIPSTEEAMPILTDETGRQISLVQRRDYLPSDRSTWYYNGAGWIYKSPERPLPGMTYNIAVTAPGFSPANASMQLPEPVPIISAVVDSANVVVNNEYGQGMYPVEVTIKDFPGTRDRYRPRMYATYDFKYYDHNSGDTIRGTNTMEVYITKSLADSEIPDFDGEEDVIDDLTFDGSEHTFRRYAQLPTYSSPNQKVTSLQFVLSRISGPYYRFFHSLEVYRNSQGNPLAEPAQVYSNVDGGLGIFAGFTNSTWEFIK